MGPEYEAMDRRPIATRNTRFAQRTAEWLAASGISPNAISIIGMMCCIVAGVCLAATSELDGAARRIAFIAAAGLIQVRLLGNLFDGMVAIATKRASPLGELFNEVPDRVSDFATLVGAGYAVGGDLVLGLVAASVAIFTAYVRAMGKVATGVQEFCGPMAKQQRMAVATVTSLYLALTPIAWQPHWRGRGLMAAALLVIVIVGALTAVRRLMRIARTLKKGMA
jgi:phosphatidylglycerophosphate synthase